MPNNQFWYSSSLFNWSSYFQWLTDSNSNLTTIEWVIVIETHLTDSISQYTHGLMEEVSVYAVYVPQNFGPWEFSLWMLLLWCCFFGINFVKRTADQCSRTPEHNEVLNGITDPFPCAIAKQLHKINAMNCFRISKNSKEWRLCVGSFYSLFSRERKTMYTLNWPINEGKQRNVSHHFICFLFVWLFECINNTHLNKTKMPGAGKEWWKWREKRVKCIRIVL